MADFDGDGLLDVVSGSYWPGDLTLFRGRDGGEFAAGRILQAAAGGNLNAGPEWTDANTPQMDSLAASPAPMDWDGDGDLDLLVGNIAGRVILIVNEGDAKHPLWGAKRAVQAGGSDLKVGGDAGPEAADWDGDGRTDLLVGDGEGAVWWFRNDGEGAETRLAAGVKLIEGLDWEASVLAHGQEPSRSGMRAKVSVCDWNRDGAPDLLVGDFLQRTRAEPQLTEAQVAERDRLRARREALSGGFPGDGSEEEREAWSTEMTEVYEALQPLEAGQDFHGFVWVYLRTGGAAAAPASASRREP